MPLMNGIQVVLQYPGAPGAVSHCRGFSGLPFTSSHYLRVDPILLNAQRSAFDLGDALAKEILGLGPNVKEIPTPCSGSGHGYCHAENQPDCRLCYVPVIDTVGSGSFTMPLWTSFSNAITVPVVRSSLHQSSIPLPLQSLNQVPLTSGNKIASGAILRAAGLLSSRPRIFISYLRSEAAILAEQLHGELIRRGFEVFLDRFSVEPGADFQARLEEELTRMGTILLIESANSNKSRWVRHEVDFSLLHRIGIVALRLPKGRATAGVTPDDRISLGDDAFTLSGRLKKNIVADVLLKIARAQALAESQRLYYLTGVLSASLAYAGFNMQSFTESQVIVAKRAGGKEHVMRVSTLPPELTDFHILDSYKTAKSRLVIAPANRMDWRRRAPIEWLGRQVNVVLKDESEIADFPRRLA